MNNNQLLTKQWLVYGAFVLCAIISVALKVNILDVGAPFVTIDDNTTYEGGFLVWFGQAPPQRMYIESWLNGLSSIITYVIYQLQTGGSIGVNIVADAYNHYQISPDLYVKSYRLVSLFIDLLSAYFIFLTARIILPSQHQLKALAVTALYLLSYNAIWCYVVARPDNPMVLLSSIGLYLYYRSNFGANLSAFLLAGLFFGAATGMKLHGAFFVVFIVLDLLRVHGFKKALPLAMSFGVISVVAFFVAAGSALFDPLTYIKLRALNAKDDVSPWIQWGDQFWEIIQGTGFLIIPLIFGAIFVAIKTKVWRTQDKIVSVILLSILWLLLFGSIRQLRAYWMLPALPLFYILGVYGLFHLKKQWQSLVVLLTLFLLMGYQSYKQSSQFASTPFNEFRAWTQANVAQDEALFIFGYDALFLPVSKTTVNNVSSGYSAMMARAKDSGESFTERHVRFWEERSRLMLFDMYIPPENAYTYYSYHKTPLAEFSELIAFRDTKYIAVLDGFIADDIDITALLSAKYNFIISVTGPGGGGSGLTYAIYEKKVNSFGK